MPIHFRRIYPTNALLAQQVEHAAVNRRVVGSSPTQGVYAGVAELADARDLKSLDPKRSYRFDPGPRHKLRLGMTRGGEAGISSGS